MENKDIVKDKVNKRKFYGYKDAGSVFSCAVIIPYAISLLFVIVLMAICKSSGADYLESVNSLWFNIVSSVLVPIVLIVIFFTYNKIHKIGFSACNVKKISAKNTVLSIIIPVVCVFCCIYLITAVDNGLVKLGYDLTSTGLPLTNAGWYILNILLLAVLPAIAEELIFRGIIFNGLRRNMSDAGAIFLSAFLFMLMHGNIEQMIYPFILGLVFAWLVMRTGSIVSSIIAHFVNNALVVTLSFIESMTGWSVITNISWLFWLLMAVLLIVGVGILLLIEFFAFKRKNADEYEKEEKTNGFSMMMIIGVAIASILFIINLILSFS